MTEQELPSMESPRGIEDPAQHPESLDHALSTGSGIAPQLSGVIAEPWLRFFARFVDLQIWVLILAFMSGFLLPSLFEQHPFFATQLGSWVFGWFLVPIAMILDAGAYSLFGNTPGKWMAGIRVKSLAGDKVSFKTYLKRNFGMYWFGLGMDIPIVVLVTLWSSYSSAEIQEAVRWDEITGTRPFVRARSIPRLVVIGAIWLLLIALQVVQIRPS